MERYFVLKTGNIVTGSELSTGYEMVYGRRWTPGGIDEVCSCFGGVEGEVKYPTVGMMLRLGREGLAVRLCANEDGCSISKARRKVRAMAGMEMEGEVLENYKDLILIRPTDGGNAGTETTDGSGNTADVNDYGEIYLGTCVPGNGMNPVKFIKLDADYGENAIHIGSVGRPEDGLPEDECVELSTDGTEDCVIPCMGGDGMDVSACSQDTEPLSDKENGSVAEEEPVFHDVDMDGGDFVPPVKKRGIVKRIFAWILFGRGDGDGYDGGFDDMERNGA